MALDALELRNVAEVHGMLEGFIGLVTELALVTITPEIDRWATDEPPDELSHTSAYDRRCSCS